ncbi:unnamed protein product [Linum tenue]|uniref:Uncharacterized protein n=1 Tax=Linum tenue TaxID=586396 RepID=A0AAV0MR44_9ROSI|nr:unnamed protein product [Linum tenue]
MSSYIPHTVSTVVMEVAAESPQETDLLSCSLQEAEEQMELINREYPEVLMKLEKQKLELASRTWSLSNLERHIESMRCTAACRKERLDPLHLAMDKLSFANNAYRDNAIKHSFLEEQEIDYRRLNFKMKHGRKSLQIERRLLREIKTKEGKDRNTTNSWSPLEDIESKVSLFEILR